MERIVDIPSAQRAFEQLARGIPLMAGPPPKAKPGHAIPFAQINGAGKVQLAVQFPTGTPVILATEA